ncbi:MAG TPA: phage tail protein [Trichocoleus sp.]
MGGWNTGRPIHGRLPQESQQYQGNEPTDWLTQPWDGLLMDSKAAADSLYADYLNPETCRADAIDWLAQLTGFTGAYWDTSWPLVVKRILIAEAFSRIWPEKGSRALLEWLLEIFELQGQLYILGDFLAGINKAGDPLGSDEGFEYFIRVPIAYLRTGASWKLMEKLNALFGPIYCQSRVTYDQFTAGFSVAGDPVFDSPIF